VKFVFAYQSTVLLYAVVLGSTPSLPAESCAEIKANEAGEAVSGNFWLEPTGSGAIILAYCDMHTEGLKIFIIHKLGLWSVNETLQKASPAKTP